MTALRIVCAFLGVLAVYSSIFLREDEEGRLQTKLEGVWLRLSDRRTSFVSRHYRAFQNVAWAASRILERIFGKRVVSWQFVAASILLSFASFDLSLWLSRPRLSSSLPIWGSALALAAVAPLLSRRLALVPALASTALLLNVLVFGLVLPGLSLVRGRPIEFPSNPYFLPTWGLAVPLSLASTVVVLVPLRRLLRSAAEEESLWRAGVKLVGLVAVTAVVLAVPFVLSGLGEAPAPTPRGGLTMQMHRTPWRSVVAEVADMNLFMVLPALLYALGLLGLLCHKAAWEGILRPLYAVKRFRPLFTHRKTVFGTGAYLLAFAVAPDRLSPQALIGRLLLGE